MATPPISDELLQATVAAYRAFGGEKTAAVTAEGNRNPKEWGLL